MSSPIIISSNGSFFELSGDGVLEDIHEIHDHEVELQKPISAGLSSNPASSSSSKPVSFSHSTQTLLGPVDVHGTWTFIKARL